MDANKAAQVTGELHKPDVIQMKGPLLGCSPLQLPMSFANLVGIDEDLPVTHHSEYAHVSYLSICLLVIYF
jgi:hypothetical protein